MENFFEVARDKKEMNNVDRLKEIFNKTEGFHEGRHRTDIASYDNLLEEVSDIENISRFDNEIHQNIHIFLKKLIGVVRANIYLRREQCKKTQMKIRTGRERIADMQEEYKRALMELNKCVELENGRYVQEEHAGENLEKTVVDLLIHIQLGKIYRDRGHFERKGNLVNAIDEFEKVKRRLESVDRNFNREETYMWLEVQVNIGRIYKNLDELELAKSCFYEMFNELKERLGDKTASFKGLILEEPKEEQIGIDSDRTIYKQKLLAEPYCYDKYMKQALIQYVILYRKERKCREAERICNILLDIDAGNMDAKNNLGVCYRKLDKYDEAKEIFLELKEGNNRFATINYYKCILHEIEASGTNMFSYDKKIKEIIKEIESWEDLKDSECQLLKCCFLLALERTEEAYKLLAKLHKDALRREDTKLEKKSRL